MGQHRLLGVVLGMALWSDKVLLLVAEVLSSGKGWWWGMASWLAQESLST